MAGLAIVNLAVFAWFLVLFRNGLGANVYRVDPSGKVVRKATTPRTIDGRPVADATLSSADPVAGRWQIDVKLDLTTSGKEFTQIVNGTATVR